MSADCVVASLSCFSIRVDHVLFCRRGLVGARRNGLAIRGTGTLPGAGRETIFVARKELNPNRKIRNVSGLDRITPAPLIGPEPPTLAPRASNPLEHRSIPKIMRLKPT